MSLHTSTKIAIDGLVLSQFYSLEIKQTINNHHEFEVVLGQEWLSTQGGSLFAQVKNLIGKEIKIEIKPELASPNFKDFNFKGLITSVMTGKQANGTFGSCTLKGYSATILLDDDAHIKAFEKKSLQSIVEDRLHNYPQNLLKSEISPKTKDTLKYTVQYKENTWDFIRRLASTYGEWCFYDGMKFKYGEHSPTEVTLTHDRDLTTFHLDMELKPGNQKFQSYEYRADKPIESDTKSQNTGSLNQVSDHVLNISDSLFTHQGLYKINHQVNSSAQEQLKHLALMQRKSRIAQMVYARGGSINPGVQVGVVVNIKEDILSQEDHGKYFVTSVTHSCTGEGNYDNNFTSIPSDAAAPSFYPDLIPNCESQSAVVVENNDPKGLGRIRVRFRWQKQGMSPWVRVVSASGGGDKGFFFIPEVGEEVWVDFEGGNPELPYVVGSTYNGSAKSSFGNAGNDVKAIKTRSGNTIKMDDKSGSIQVSDPSGGCVTLHGDGTLSISAPKKIIINSEEIEIGAKKGISIFAQQDSVTISGKKNVSIEALDEGVSLTAKKDVTIDATENVVVTATLNTDLNASQELNLSGGSKAVLTSAATDIM